MQVKVSSFVNVLLVMALFAMFGCGGGTTPSQQSSDNTPPIDSAIFKASDYTGSWSGVLSGQPLSISLVGVDGANTVAGNVYSVGFSGPFTGTVKTDGTVTGTVANKLDGHTWTVAMTRASAGLNLTEVTYGTASLGAGSCTSTPTINTNMSGSWVGYMVKMDWLGSNPISSETQNVNVELAYGGANTFVGAIVSDSGLSARVKYQVVSGYWVSQIDQAFSWGNNIASPKSGLILTQGMITSTALMDEHFTNNPLAPTAMQGATFTTSYDFTWPNGVTGSTSDQHRLYLVRPGQSLSCPSGLTWNVDTSKCVAN